MTDFSTYRTARILADSFYSIFGANPKDDLHLSAQDIYARRGAINAWNRFVYEGLIPASTQEIGEVYDILLQKLDNKEMSRLTISFQGDNNPKFAEAPHPLLRAVEFAGRSKRSILAYSAMTMKRLTGRAVELGDIEGNPTPVISHLFLSVEEKAPAHFEDVIRYALAFEKEVGKKALRPDDVRKNLSILKSTFSQMVDRSDNASIYDIDPLILMKWEAIVEPALKGLSLQELKALYDDNRNHQDCFEEARMYESPDYRALRVVRREIEYACLSRSDISLEGPKERRSLDDQENLGDPRVRHLTSDHYSSGALERAFGRALASEIGLPSNVIPFNPDRPRSYSRKRLRASAGLSRS